MPKTNPSRLSDSHTVLVLDASVAINLLGTGRPRDILAALRQKVIIENTTMREVRRDPYSNQPASGIMTDLIVDNTLEAAELSGTALDEFVGLVSAASPDDLGDGEAAAIALAEDIAADFVTDDRKATRIALSRRPDRPPLTSFDLLTCPMIETQFGASAIDVLYNALTCARMRISPELRAWTVERLGEDRARNCPGLSASWRIHR